MDTTSRRGPVYKRLMLASFGAGRVAAQSAQGIGDEASAGKSALPHQPAKREGGPLPMGMEPGKGRGPLEPAPVNREVKLNQSGGGRRGFALVVHTNYAVPTSTRKRTQQVPFLVVVK